MKQGLAQLPHRLAVPKKKIYDSTLQKSTSFRIKGDEERKQGIITLKRNIAADKKEGDVKIWKIDGPKWGIN